MTRGARRGAGAPERWAFGLAAGSLSLATATGVGAQTGALDTSSVRWVHHALYAASLGTAIVALALAPRQRRLALAPGALALIALARTSGGTPRHAGTALLAGGSYVVAAALR